MYKPHNPGQECILQTQKKLTPKTPLLIGPLYLTSTLIVVVTATIQDASTASTSPTSRFFCTTEERINVRQCSKEITTY